MGGVVLLGLRGVGRFVRDVYCCGLFGIYDSCMLLSYCDLLDSRATIMRGYLRMSALNSTYALGEGIFHNGYYGDVMV